MYLPWGTGDAGGAVCSGLIAPAHTGRNSRFRTTSPCVRGLSRKRHMIAWCRRKAGAASETLPRLCADAAPECPEGLSIHHKAAVDSAAEMFSE